MRKFICLLSALCLVLGAAGVFAEDEVTHLVFWHSAADRMGEALNAYVDRFNDTVGTKKGIFVESVYQGSYTDSSTKLGSLLSAENYSDLPDVLQMDATGKLRYLSAPTAYTAQQALSDHPNFSAEDFIASAYSNWCINGVQLGLPFATSTTLTYYNATILDEAPDTLGDIAAIADDYDLEEGAMIYACVPNTPTLANWLGQLGSYVVDRKNGSEATATALDCIEDGSLVKFLSAWKELYASGALVNRASSNDEFAAGRQLVMTASSSMIAALTERIGGRFELGVSSYLRVSDEAAFGATVSGSCLVMFDQGDSRREAAWEFVRYMTSAEVQAGFAAETGYIPSRLSAVKTEAWQAFIAENPAYSVGLEQLSRTPDTMCPVSVGPAADFYYTIQDIISDMLDRDLSPEETAEIMEEELNGLLEQYQKANP